MHYSTLPKATDLHERVLLWNSDAGCYWRFEAETRLSNR
jgi:hypothetical protein